MGSPWLATHRSPTSRRPLSSRTERVRAFPAFFGTPTIVTADGLPKNRDWTENSKVVACSMSWNPTIGSRSLKAARRICCTSASVTPE